jgi:mycothiol synthase
VGRYSIDVRDTREDSDAEIAEWLAVLNALSAEVDPESAPTPLAETIALLRTAPDRYRLWSILARDETGALVGVARMEYDPDHDENPDLFNVSLGVLPEHRRLGVGTELLAAVGKVAREEGRTRLLGVTSESVPAGAEFALAIGAESKLESHVNRLLLADVDRAELQRWVDEGPTRAPDYEIINWGTEVPEPYLADWADLIGVMNTAPRDDLELNDTHATPEQIREGEKQLLAIGAEMWVLAARRRSDGAWAGFHNLVWYPWDPACLHIGATGVRPEHRGHALGKWLKGAMTLRVLDERPEATWIETDNADSNDAMLGINRLMGYRPWIAETLWELATATLD